MKKYNNVPIGEMKLATILLAIVIGQLVADLIGNDFRSLTIHLTIVWIGFLLAKGITANE